MNTIRIIALCVGAALICAMLRQHRPEIAAMISLAVGVGVFLMAESSLRDVSDSIRKFLAYAPIQSEHSSAVLKAAGISIISELGVQICCDAGESALAGRIRLACRMIMLMMAMPGLVGILDAIAMVAG